MNVPASASRRASKRGGFTLIELLTVIAIIGILAAILIPTVGKVRSSAQTVKCVSQMRVWSQVVKLFANDNKGDIALTINVGGGDPRTMTDGIGKLYSTYFDVLRLDNLGVTDKESLDPMEYFSSCPSVNRAGLNTSATRRSVSFMVPIGAVAVPGGGSRFGRINVGGLDYYNESKASAPSRLFLMLEELPGSPGIIRGSSFATDVVTRVRPVLSNQADPTTVRHGGIINVLFLDGSVRAQKITDVDPNFVAPAQRASFAQRYTL
jgi:prepilin-type N-terminal cleavage/methylation domain-containing protein/prepilin-type processing-associated H-X9-DG protein